MAAALLDKNVTRALSAPPPHRVEVITYVIQGEGSVCDRQLGARDEVLKAFLRDINTHL